jgi:hypothetical protein
MESETKRNAVAARKGGGRAFHSRVEPFVAIIRARRRTSLLRGFDSWDFLRSSTDHQHISAIGVARLELSAVIPTNDLARAMVEVAVRGTGERESLIFENRDIRSFMFKGK